MSLEALRFTAHHSCCLGANGRQKKNIYNKHTCNANSSSSPKANRETPLDSPPFVKQFHSQTEVGASQLSSKQAVSELLLLNQSLMHS